MTACICVCISGSKVLISALLEVNPTVRLTASQTLQNSWLLHAAAQSDQEEATDTSNLIIKNSDQLKSECKKHGSWGNQQMLAEITQVAQNEGNRESSTNKYKETNMDQKDKQTPERPSQVREISKNGYRLGVSVLVQKADIPE